MARLNKSRRIIVGTALATILAAGATVTATNDVSKNNDPAPQAVVVADTARMEAAASRTSVRVTPQAAAAVELATSIIEAADQVSDETATVPQQAEVAETTAVLNELIRRATIADQADAPIKVEVEAAPTVVIAADAAVTAAVAATPGAAGAEDPQVLAQAIFATAHSLESAVKTANAPMTADEAGNNERVVRDTAIKADAELTAQFTADALTYGNGQIPNDLLCTISYDQTGEFLRCDAAAAFEAMNAAYKAAFGRNIEITDTYRSLEFQQELKWQLGSYAATPGTSNHGWGVAMDLGDGIELDDSQAHAWMVANAGSFGWVNPDWAQDWDPSNGEHEPWHWEFVG